MVFKVAVFGKRVLRKVFSLPLVIIAVIVDWSVIMRPVLSLLSKLVVLFLFRVLCLLVVVSSAKPGIIVLVTILVTIVIFFIIVKFIIIIFIFFVFIRNLNWLGVFMFRFDWWWCRDYCSRFGGFMCWWKRRRRWRSGSFFGFWGRCPGSFSGFRR